MPFDTDTTTSYETQEDVTGSGVYTRRADGTEPQREEGHSADEVNPRLLMKDPDIDSVRWLARTGFGGAIVKKPVKDAFKYGFEVIDEDGEPDQAASVLDRLDWEEHYIDAQIKARRDGFALVFAVLEDNADATADALDEDVTVQDVQKLEVLTLDDLAKFNDNSVSPSGRFGQALPEDLRDDDDIEIRKTGLVVDMDPNSEDYKEPLGYLVGKDRAAQPDDIDFIHRSRIVHHLVWEGWVDGDLDEDTLGEWEGDSILVSSYHILRGIKKGNWSIMQTLFRYAAKLYHVEMPEDADDEDWDQAQDNLQNLNALSEFITPAGYEVDDFGTDGQLEPREYFDVLFDQVCASNEMTKSVLFGTQTGTVSGSETDIKNYFNKVERMRTGRIERDMAEAVTWYRRVVDGRTGEDFEAEFEVEWGPLFKMTELDRAEALSRKMGTLATAINNFVMTPNEARQILQEDWAESNIEWDDLTETEVEFLESLNIAQQGAPQPLSGNQTQSEGQGNPTEGNPQVGQNGGGRPPGASGSQDPTADQLDYDLLADKVAERLDNGQKRTYEL